MENGPFIDDLPKKYGDYFHIIIPICKMYGWLYHCLSSLSPLLPSGKRLHNELERSTILNGKIHYFNGHF